MSNGTFMRILPENPIRPYNQRMSLEPVQSLLHYRVVEKIGEGGMGVPAIY